MELFLIPLLILVVVVALGLLLLKTAKRRSTPTNDGSETGRRPGLNATSATSKEHSEAASVRLNQQQHTAVYSAIARGDALRAIKEYRAATGAGLRQAAAAVANMSAHPQPYTPPPAPKPEDDPTTGQPQSDAAPERGTASEPVTAPEPGATSDTSAARAGVTPATGYRYRAIASKGDEIREIASTRPNDEVFARIRARALEGDKEAAVQLLMEHSDASRQEASGFVELIHEEPPAGAPEGS